MYRKAYFIGFAAYIYMLALSFIFYKERTVFLDMAFNLFYIIKDGGFAIQIYRFGDILSQLPPWLAVKAGLPIAIILKSYSAGFVIYYLIAYLICGSVLKRYDFALIILLQSILFASDTFYWMLSQLPQAIAMLVTILAYISNHKEGTIKTPGWALVTATLITLVFFHPLIVFVLGFCIMFFLFSKQSTPDRKLLYTIVALYAAGMILKFIFFRAPYEQHSMSGMKNFLTLFPDYITLYSNKRFLHNCLTKYYWLPVLFTGIISFYAWNRERRKLYLLAGSFFAYLMLVNISYPFPITPDFYIENLYLPLGIFITLPFVFDIWPVLQQRKLALPLLLTIIITGGIRLYTTHNIYTARLDYERKMLDVYADKKIILKGRQADTGALLMLWGTPYEFWLLSTLERGKTASIIIDDDPSRRDWAKQHKQDFIVNWNFYAYKDLPAQYFHLTDTTSGYTIGGPGN